MYFGPGQGVSIPDSAHNYGYGPQSGQTPLATLGLTAAQDTKRATAALDVDWRPATWFRGHVTSGLDHGAQRSQSTKLAQSIFVARHQDNAGSTSIANSTTDISSGDVRGAVTLPVTAWMKSVTSVGLQYADSKYQGVTATASNLQPINTGVNGAPSTQVSEQGDESATEGGYVEQQLAMYDRLFLTAAVRLDGASGFGKDYHVTAYPKASVSWLAVNSDQATVRLRSALGAAGQQPLNGASFPVFSAGTVYAGGQTVSASVFNSPGNPNLKPERSRELEGGIDVSLLENRVTVDLTKYRKETKDALITRSLGWDVSNGFAQQNLGDIRNVGTEVSVHGIVIQSAPMTWDVGVNWSSNNNKLLKLAPGVSRQDAGPQQYFAVGYPLYGYWVRDLTFNDADGNGIITRSETVVSDSDRFIGSSLPKSETAFNSQMTFFHGLIGVNALFDYLHGGVVNTGYVINNNAGNGSARAQNDRTAPLADQAVAVASARGLRTNLDFSNVSFVRFRELSMTYNVPDRLVRRLGLHTFSATLAARNLGLWTTEFKGIDPETSSPGGNNNYNGNANNRNGINNDARVDLGNATPLSRTWTIRFNTGL